MIPLRIDGADVIMRGNSPDVRDLHIKRIDGCLVSRWEPTPKELATLNAGGSIELWVMGSQQPPVILQAVSHVTTNEGSGA